MSGAMSPVTPNRHQQLQAALQQADIELALEQQRDQQAALMQQQNGSHQQPQQPEALSDALLTQPEDEASPVELKQEAPEVKTCFRVFLCIIIECPVVLQDVSMELTKSHTSLIRSFDPLATPNLKLDSLAS